MLTVLLQGCWANNPVIPADIFMHVIYAYILVYTVSDVYMQIV